MFDKTTVRVLVLLMMLIPLLQALYLLEFLELNSLLGVTHFTFYNHTIGPKASCILQHYVNGNLPPMITPFWGTSPAGSTPQDSNDVHRRAAKSNQNDNTKPGVYQKPRITVNILPWNLRMRSQKEIRTEGLFASLNDCLYRSMYR